MKRVVLIFIAWIITMSGAVLSGQEFTNRIIVANGGAYSDPNDFVTITAYDPSMQTTELLATIRTHSVQGLLVHEGIAFVAAQDSLARINIDSGEVEAIVALQGVNKFAVYGDKLLVSRQFPVNADFVQVRDIADLTLIKSFSEISDEAWEMIVVGDSAYVSVAGGWASTVGKLAVIDLASLEFVSEINVGADAVGIGPAFQYGDQLVFVCKTPWGGNTGNILKYEINTRAYTVHQVSAAIGKAAGINNGLLYITMNGNVGTIDLGSMSIADAILIQNPFSTLDITSLCLDQISEKILVNYSYWIPPNGQGIIYNLDGTQVGTYPVGVSAEEVAVDYRNFTSMNDLKNLGEQISVYPNPSADFLTISHVPANSKIAVFDINGKQLYELIRTKGNVATIDVTELRAGLYLLIIEPLEIGNSTTHPGSLNSRKSMTFIKQ